jgi:hypothetical protein
MSLAAESVPGENIRPVDAEVTGNDLTAKERKLLELLVEQYLLFAERQAEQREAMRMADWEEKLDALLRLNGLPVLEHAGQDAAAPARAAAARERAKPSARRRGD